jgi:ABC-type transport system substrate-binding protein
MYAGAGYNSCVLGTRLQVLVEDQAEALAKALVAQWQTSLGCNPFQFIVKKASPETLQNVAHGTVNTNDPNALPRPEMWIYWWSPDYPDANAWSGDAIHCQYGFLRTGVACGDGDALVDQAFLETDNAKRADLYSRAEESWFGPQGTFPVAPLYVSINYVAQQPWLKGATVNGPMRFDLWMLGDHR